MLLLLDVTNINTDSYMPNLGFDFICMFCNIKDDDSCDPKRHDSYHYKRWYVSCKYSRQLITY
jgi:hypothetical protein